MIASRNIPTGVKRKVRRACGFGCVICGHPIIEYDHIVPFSQVKSHDVDNLCCLCPTHHAEKTRKIIPTEFVAKARSSPLNIKTKYSKPHPLYYFGDRCFVEIGSIRNIMFKQPKSPKTIVYSPLVIRDEELIKVKFDRDGIIFVDLTIRNELDDFIIKIVENELLFKADLWDVEFVANKLRIVRRDGDTALEMIFKAPYGASIVRGILWNRGSFLRIQDGHVLTKSSNGACDGIFVNTRYGIVYNSREDFAPSGLFLID